MTDKSKYKAIEDNGQRIVFTDHARKRLYTLDIIQYLNKNLELMRNDRADDVDYVAKATELDFVRRNIGSGWVPVVLSCKSFLMCRSDSGFHLINPATKEWKKVPKTPLTKMPFSWDLYGFGFDESSGQYKVVEGKGSTDGFVFTVYASLTDSWRKIETLFPYKQTRICKKDGVLLNGAVHWLVKRDESLVIVSFLLAEEEVREIQVPATRNCGSVELGVFRDKLCLTAFASSFPERYMMFWVLNGDSWTKMDFAIAYHRLQHCGFRTEPYDLMLVDAVGLLMCDFDDKHCWSFSVSHSLGEVSGFGSIGVYKERALSPLLINNNRIQAKMMDVLEYYC